MASTKHNKDQDRKPYQLQADGTGDSLKPGKDSPDTDVAAVNEQLADLVGSGDTPEIHTLQDDADNLLQGDQPPLNDELAEALATTDISADGSADTSAAEPPVSDTEKPDAKAENSAEQATGDEDGLPDDETTRQAVDDIVAEEADVVLEAEDALHADDSEPAVQPVQKGRLRRFFSAIWQDPRKRLLFLAGTGLLLAVAAAVPHSRYFVLNNVGVRASLSVTVIDEGTLQPLKNVSVSAAGVQSQTDGDGYAKLTGVRLGRTTLRISKRAFAVQERQVTVGWGSNPLGEVSASAVGSQYVFMIKDFLSGKPVADAEASSGEGNARSDESGKLVLTLDTAELDDAAQLSVIISADDYRTETVNLTVNNREEQAVEMVPSRKHVFVSKRSGKYDVYAIDADGKNERKLVGGTGLERDDITLVPHQKEPVAAYVATRERVLNANGYLLSTLYVLDTGSGELVKIDQSEQIQVIGWSSSGRIIYVKIAAGASGTDPKRHRLMSFNALDYTDTKELASSNAFNDVIMVGDLVYYAPSNLFQDNPDASLMAVDAEGKNYAKVVGQEVYTLVRTAYGELHISTGTDWFAYDLKAGGTPVKSAQPSAQHRIYADDSSRSRSLWTDSRDGKGVLLLQSLDGGQETTLASLSGLQQPVYWLDDRHAVMRVSDSRETADYIVSTEGGEPRKITDVSDASGIRRWYYY